ncbi:N-acetyltransferase [Kushneria phosphatilytica]|uniref:N-acetyltransferase n=1 Tax=Kushneria phosphatilytica TaxID=657387 RepID=A0A1S1NV47_9GAMM|nr:N-acetyltransferase [Kushneria phosphatilytica]OHV08746.1 N-acetyltransferase [Kushneria phosphatilytica]QEL12467.1 N-acetyltransferase [Kushneria phosphatilytica]
MEIIEVRSKAEKRRFVDIQFRLNRDDPAWIPPLRDEMMGLISEHKNPWFGHGTAGFFIAMRDGVDVGRISAQIDRLWSEMPESQGGGQDTGHWGMFEAIDETVAAALIAHAEQWLQARGVTRAIGPISISIWDEPGLLVQGHEQSPTVMMGHHKAIYQQWIEQAGYRGVKDLNTYELDISKPFPPLIQRIVDSGERNTRIRIRQIDKKRFDEEATLILSLLNDAWSDNWGFVPLTDAEIAYAGKKLKPIVFPELIYVAEFDGEPVAFMLTLPNLNELQQDLDGRLFPFGFLKLLWRLNGGLSGRPAVNTVRVPLMGVKRELQASRLASQIAFMMIEYTRRASVEHFGASRAEIGWILEDNQGMVSIARAIESRLNRVYRIHERTMTD